MSSDHYTSSLRTKIIVQGSMIYDSFAKRHGQSGFSIAKLFTQKLKGKKYLLLADR